MMCLYVPGCRAEKLGDRGVRVLNNSEELHWVGVVDPVDLEHLRHFVIIFFVYL